MLVAAAAGAAAAASAAPPEARLRSLAVRCEDRELPLHLRGPALGAVRLLAVPHELLEVLLARHADVLVDRHGPSLASRGEARTDARVAPAADEAPPLLV